ncbi:MAG: DNA methyltransferase, partial [bacterium]|nr:DNA methyltransferase [bacterium]
MYNEIMQENTQSAITSYIEDVQTQYRSGQAKEHAYRPALKTLMSSFENALAVNDPKRSQHGNPDFVFLKKSNKGVILGYAEAKDIDISLDKTEKTDQMRRYAGYDNLFLTNYLDFRFYKNGNKYQTIIIGELKDGEIKFFSENFSHLESELKAFLEQSPETIKNGKRLAQIM